MGNLTIKECQQTLIQTLEPHCFDSNIGMVKDPPELTAHWSQGLCVSARWMPLRALIFTQDLRLAIYPCCRFIHPTGYSDQYKLVQYVPITSYEKAKNFNKTMEYHVSLILENKADIAPFDSGLAIVIADVIMGRILVSGRATEVTNFAHGSLDFVIDASNSSGINYQQFISMISGFPLKQEAEIASVDNLQNLHKSVDSGFMRVY